MPTTLHFHNHQYEYPSLVRRMQSTVIDFIIKLALITVFAQMINQYENFPIWARIALFSLIILYEPLCVTLGCTIGNYLLGIRVRQFADDSKRINFLQAVFRYAFKLLLGWISFLTIHSNSEKRAIHDIVGSSVMVRIK